MKEIHLPEEQERHFREKIASIQKDTTEHKFEDAKTKLDDLKNNEQFVNCAEYKQFLGLLYQAKGEYNKAIREFEDIIYEKETELTCLPGNLENLLFCVLYDIGRTHLLNHNYLEASEYYKKALEKNIDNPDTLNELGVTYNFLGKYKDALETYQKALNKCPDKGTIIANIAANYLDWGRPAQALNYFRSALDVFQRKLDQESDETKKANLDLHKASILINIAKIELNESLYDSAEVNLEIARDIYSFRASYIEKLGPKERSGQNETIGELHNNLGTLYYKQNYYDKAKKEYKKALKRKPISAQFYNNLANVYVKKGDNEQAERLYNEALRIDPDMDAAMENIKTLRGIQVTNWWKWWFSKKDFKAALGVSLFLILFLLFVSIMAQSWLFSETTKVTTIIEPMPSSFQENTTKVEKNVTVQDKTNTTTVNSKESFLVNPTKTQTTTEKSSPASPESKLILMALVIFVLMHPSIKGISAGQVKFDLTIESTTPARSDLRVEDQCEILRIIDE